MKRWVFDLDGTLCDTVYTIKWEYTKAKPKYDMINKVNELYDRGDYITIFTARGTMTGIDWYDFTKDQIDLWGLKYNELRLRKPMGHLYVDDRAITPKQFLMDGEWYYDDKKRRILHEDKK